MRRISGMILLLSLAVLMAGCGPKGDVVQDRFGAETRYLQNNLHAQVGGRDIKASYANWTQPGSGHVIIPVNTPVMLQTGRRGHFMITEMQHGRQIHFEYSAENMRMPVESYFDLITAPYEVALAQLSDLDRKGIQEGRVYEGMTKDGVRIALGYPAAHLTPSLEANTWVFWKNRFTTTVITFNDAGQVVTIQ